LIVFDTLSVERPTGTVLADKTVTTAYQTAGRRQAASGPTPAEPAGYCDTTKKRYGNFELRLQCKLVGKGANAGIQFRTKRLGRICVTLP
jgi:hypothetical protein